MIRSLVVDDISWVVPQEQLIFGHTLGEDHYLTMMNLSSLFGYVVDHQAALLCSQNGEHAQIENLFVVSEVQRQGIATLLLKQLLQELPHRGIRYVSLEVRVDLTYVMELYQSMGFKTVKQISNYYPDQTDAYYMVYERNNG